MAQKAKITSAHVSYFMPTGHGLCLTVKGLSPNFSSTELKVNIFGDVWKAVPSAVSSMIQFTLLPMTLGPETGNFLKSFASGNGHKDLELRVATKESGVGGVLHGTIAAQLAKQIAAGDPTFLLEFTNERGQVVLEIVTKPSLIKTGLQNPKFNIASNEKFQKPKSTFDFFYILILLALFGFVLAFAFPRAYDAGESHLIQLSQLNIPTKGYYHTVSVGYNSCLDLIVRATHVLEKLRLEGAGNILHPQIHTKKEFAQTFAYAFEAGVAVERFIENITVCNQIISASKLLPQRRTSIGGNAPLMALRFAQLGSQVLLGGAVGPDLRQLIHDEAEDSISFLPGGQEMDEVHLIMEYSKGETWALKFAPRANRMIVHCDHTSSKIGVLESFHQQVNQLEPNLVVLSGLHMLEREPPQFRSERLVSVAKAISKVPISTPVHVEIASISSTDFIKEISSVVLPFADSLGLNEQELGDLSRAIGADCHKGDELAFNTPKVSTIICALTNVITASEKLNTVGHRLGRIHFHALEYHIVAVKANTPWTNATESVAAGSLAASFKACSVSNFFLDVWHSKFKLLFDSNSWGTTQPPEQQNGVFSWTKNGIQFSLAPVAVCKNPQKTVGLGDAISASGLAFHRFQAQ